MSVLLWFPLFSGIAAWSLGALYAAVSKTDRHKNIGEAINKIGAALMVLYGASALILVALD